MEPDYNAKDTYDFGSALDFLKQGERVCRSGWNGKDMWLYLIKASDYSVTEKIDRFCSDEGGPFSKDLLPWIGMKTADNKFVPWLASQTDLLSNDWEILPDENGLLPA